VKIWFVIDPLSGDPLNDRYFSTEEEARAERERLGYGFVSSWNTYAPEE
jgi:hypothetical protein